MKTRGSDPPGLRRSRVYASGMVGSGDRWRGVLCVACAVVIAACTSESNVGEESTASSAPDPSVASTVPQTTAAPVTTIAPLATWVPDGFDDIELVVPVDEAAPGDTVEVTIVCPHRDAAWEAYLRVDHLDETFEQQEVARSGPDEFATSFAVPYWLEPGEIVLRGGCPSPPGPCDDTGDCPEYLIDTTPPVPLTLLPRSEPWDAWRPLTEPYIAPPPTAGAALPGGAVVEAAGDGWAALRASVGDRVTIAALCSPAAEASGGRFVVMPSRTRETDLYQDDWNWSIDGDPAVSGRYVVANETLQQAELVLGDPLPWFLEVAGSIQEVNEAGTVITAVVEIDRSLVEQGDRDFVFGALCEDVDGPFDPRSIDPRAASQFGVTVSPELGFANRRDQR